MHHLIAVIIVLTVFRDGTQFKMTAVCKNDCDTLEVCKLDRIELIDRLTKESEATANMAVYWLVSTLVHPDYIQR